MIVSVNYFLVLLYIGFDYNFDYTSVLQDINNCTYVFIFYLPYYTIFKLCNHKTTHKPCLSHSQTSTKKNSLCSIEFTFISLSHTRHQIFFSQEHSKIPTITFPRYLIHGILAWKLCGLMLEQLVSHLKWRRVTKMRIITSLN